MIPQNRQGLLSILRSLEELLEDMRKNGEFGVNELQAQNQLMVAVLNLNVTMRMQQKQKP